MPPLNSKYMCAYMHAHVHARVFVRACVSMHMCFVALVTQTNQILIVCHLLISNTCMDVYMAVLITLTTRK